MSKKTKDGVVEHQEARAGASATPPATLSESEKIAAISQSFTDILRTLGLDLNEAALRESPQRVAQLFVKELFYGLDPSKKPTLTIFPNHFQFRSMLVERNIPLISTCADHFLPIMGRVHVGYFPGTHIIGLSDIHKVTDYYARRPQIPAQLAAQMLDALTEALETPDVMVAIQAQYFCVHCRGTEAHSSDTLAMEFSGKFAEDAYRNDFLKCIS